MVLVKKSLRLHSIIALAISLAIVACSGGQADETESSPFADGPDSIAGTDQYTVRIETDANPNALRLAAQEFCSEKQWCQIMGWRDDANRPKAMPMVKREYDSVAFSYLINRNSSHEKTMWDCRIWDGPPDACLNPDVDD